MTLAVILVGSIGAIRFAIAALILVETSDSQTRLVSVVLVTVDCPATSLKCQI